STIKRMTGPYTTSIEVTDLAVGTTYYAKARVLQKAQTKKLQLSAWTPYSTQQTITPAGLSTTDVADGLLPKSKIDSMGSWAQSDIPLLDKTKINSTGTF